MEVTLGEAFGKAIEAHRLGNIQEAEKFYRSVLEIQPRHADANHNMGVIAISLGKAEEAIPFFKTAIEANSKVVQFWVSYINTFIGLGNLEEARKIYDEATKKGIKGDVFEKIAVRINYLKTDLDGEKQQVHFQHKIQELANLYNQGNLADVLQKGESLAIQFPDEFVLFNLLGVSSAGLGKYQASVRFLNKAIELNPNYGDGYNNLGITLTQSGDFDGAVESFKQAIRLKSDDAKVHYNLGYAFSKGRDLGSALDSFRQALRVNPDYAEALNSMGSILKEQGHIEEAAENYQKALRVKPNYAEAHNNLGLLLKDRGDLDGALVSFEKALEINPDSSEFFFNIGIVLELQGDLEAAIESFKRAIRLRPEYAEAYLNLGSAFLANKDNDDAIDSFNQAIRINPDFAEAHVNLATVLVANKDYSGAIEVCEKALRLNPEIGETHHLMGKAFFDLGDYEAAKNYFESSADASFTPQFSIARAAECLFHSGKYTDLNTYIAKIANKDKCNIRLSSLSVFVAQQLGEKNLYPFCPKPMDLVSITNLLDDGLCEDDFLKEVLHEAETRRSIWEPINKSTKSGFQTLGNLFDSPSKIITEFKALIDKEIDTYYAKFRDNDCAFISEWPEKNQLQGWFVKLIQSGYQDYHIHPTGWLSGVVYLKTIESSDKEEGAIEFGLHGYDYPIINDNFPRFLHRPQEGDIALFPSSLFHRTFPITRDAERCVIAFDLVPEFPTN